ncbi:hypothetical protein [Notoacmeibacter ruber]|uniref:Uncharacterized protein n=1 Tax=Notoacmeibacter ruber TaxID=2670375 RepID=A0A3L7JF18_9HYPH|nr:hypothetical protein [Notoacmeibacter ruber]RLQ88919.1 hypothetical protein D8780_12460 [Notoacmeibacter ruber]
MYSRVTMETGHHVRPVDIANFGAFPQQGLESVLQDFLERVNSYAGFATTIDGLTRVQVDRGHAMIGGRFYLRGEAGPVELTSAVPLNAGKSAKVWIAAQGVDDRSDPTVTRDRTVAVDDGNGGSVKQVQTVDAVPSVTNIAELTALVGPSGATGSPLADPAVPTNTVPFVEIVLDGATGGIVAGSLRSLPQFRAANLRDVYISVQALMARDAAFAAEIQALRNEMVGLQKQLSATASPTAITGLLEDVAHLKDLADIEDVNSDAGYDRFLDEGESATGHVDFAARVEEGARAPYANENRAALALKSPNDQRLMHANAGLVFPAYDPVIGFSVHGSGSTPLGGTVTNSIQIKEGIRTRSRVRYGQVFKVCTNSNWWQSGRYNPLTGIFTRAGEQYEYISGDYTRNHRGIRLKQVFLDTWQEPYVYPEEVTQTLTGVIKCQTFQQGQDRYVPAIRLGLLSWEPGAEITATFIETDERGPRPDRALGSVTVAAEAFRQYVNGDPATMTRFALPVPVFAKRGTYGVIFTVSGNVTAALSSIEDGTYLGGDYYESTSGQLLVGSIDRDLAIAVEYCHFRATTLNVPLANLNLDGGIGGASIICGVTRPENTGYAYRAFSAGGWKTLAAIPTTAYDEAIFGNGLQATYDFEVLLTGNEWVMPVLDLTQSEVELFRPGTEMHHVSVPRILRNGIAYSKLTVRAQFSNFDEARHTLGCYIRDGAALDNRIDPIGAPIVSYLKNIDRHRVEWVFPVDPADGQFELHLTTETDNANVPVFPEYSYYEAMPA